MTITCNLCQATVDSISEAIKAEWHAEYYDGDDQMDAICNSCAMSKCHVANDGELELVRDGVIINAALSMSIRSTICDYMRGKSNPTKDDMLCFVGMIETGEARLSDFAFVGGDLLSDSVSDAITLNAKGTQCLN